MVRGGGGGGQAGTMAVLSEQQTEGQPHVERWEETRVLGEGRSQADGELGDKD